MKYIRGLSLFFLIILCGALGVFIGQFLGDITNAEKAVRSAALKPGQSPVILGQGGLLRINRVTPSGEDITPPRQIVFQFNRAVVPIGRMTRDKKDIPVHISPELKCEWRWLNTSALACQLSDKDTPREATEYKIIMEPGIQAQDGAIIEKAYKASFITQRPIIRSTRFRTWEGPGSPVIQVVFNHAVSKASVEKFVAFEYASEDVAGVKITTQISVKPDLDSRETPRYITAPGESYILDFGPQDGAGQMADDELQTFKGQKNTGQEARRVWLVSPKKPLPLNSNIDLKVKPGIVSAMGSENGIEDRVAVNFYTFPDFEFLGVKCVSNERERLLITPENTKNIEKCNPLRAVSLSFSAPVLSSQIEVNAQITPPLNGGRKDYNPWENRYDYSFLRRPHRLNQTYDITLPERLKAAHSYNLKLSNKDRNESEDNSANAIAAIEDEFGRRLKTSVNLNFFTDHRLPNFELIHTTAVLEQGVDSDVPLYVTNLDEAELNYTALTQAGRKTDQTSKLNNIGTAKDVQFAMPMKVRDMLGGASGAVYGYLSTQPDVDKHANSRRLFAVVSPYQIHVKAGHYNTLVWVVDLKTGLPVPGAKVQIYKDYISQISSDVEVLDQAVSDSTGQVMLKGLEDLDPKNDLLKWCNTDNCERLFIRVDKDDEMSLMPLDNRFALNAYRVSNYTIWERPEKKYGHIDSWGTTAQGVYRAGGTIQYKIYVRDQNNETYIAAPKGTYQLEIIDPTGKIAHEVKDITLSEFGGLHGEFTIPETAPIGWYQFQLKADFTKDYVWTPMRVLVSDFTPSPFKVTNSLNSDLFQPEDVLTVETQSRLHSGGPYIDAEIRVTGTFRPSPFSSHHPVAAGFKFSNESHVSRRPYTIFSQIDLVDDNGERSHDIDLSKIKSIHGYLTVESAVRDDRGKYIAASGRAKYMGVDRLVGLNARQWIYDADKPADIEYIVVDERGVPAAGSDVDLKIEYLTVKSAKVKGAGNSYVTNFIRTWDVVGSCEGTSKTSVQICGFTPKKPGNYKITATITDSKNRKHSSVLPIWVAGKGRVIWEEPNDNSLQIIAEATNYNIGDTARYLIKNPYEKAQALISIERYGVLKSWVQPLGSSTPVIEFEVTKDMMPGFYLSVTAMSPRVDSPLPEYGQVDLGKPSFKTGYIQVNVKDPYKKIDVTAVTDAPIYKPRDVVKLNLHAEPKFKDKTEPIEMAVVVLDEAVLDLIQGGASYFDPYEGFYDLDGLDVRNFSLLTRLLGRQKFEKKGANPGGDGGADFSVRSLFKYVSYWNPSVIADENGDAELEFTVPDNLTGWRVLAFAVTPSDRMGLGDVNFKVNRPTEVRPVMPNQVMEGDRFKAGFNVMNRTDKTRKITVNISARGPLKKGKACSDDDDLRPAIKCTYETTIRLKPFKRKTVYMPVNAAILPQDKNAPNGRIDFIVSASDKIDSDGVTHILPVNKRRSLDVAANYAMTTDSTVTEALLFPENIHTDTGQVSVVLSPSVIGNVEGAFTYIRDYSYTSWESKLTRGVMASHYQNLKAYMPEDFTWKASETLPQDILKQASNYQAPNGGMAYYRTQDEYVSPYLSAYTALAFNWLRDSGYDVPETVEANLHSYLGRLLKKNVVPTFYSRGMSSSVRAVALAALSEHGVISAEDLERYRSELGYMDLFGKAHYLQAAMNVDGADELQAAITESILAASFQSGGKFSFNEELDDGYARILATPMRANCAILSTFSVMSQSGKDKDLIGDIPFKLTRTITQTRGKRDHWENTQENIFCMNGLIDYARIYEATTPDLTVSVDIDGTAIGQAKFSALKDPQVTLSKPITKTDVGMRRTVNISRTGQGQLYYATRMHYAPLDIAAQTQNAGIDIRKELSVMRGDEWVLLDNPSKIKRGDLVRVDIFVSLPVARNFVVVDDPIPGGLEPVNRDLATASIVDADKGQFKASAGSWWFNFTDWGYYNVSRWSFHHKELRHDAARFYSDYLPAGNYVLSYTAQAIAEGEFTQLPIHAEESYDPDVYGKGLPRTLHVNGSVGQP